jgi:hypothetical protein
MKIQILVELTDDSANENFRKLLGELATLPLDKAMGVKSVNWGLVQEEMDKEKENVPN